MKNNLKEIMDLMIEKHGTDITITWEGGNDEGSYELLVDDEPLSISWGNKESIEYRLIDMLGDIIGHYSFAGDFSCNGSATYDPEQNAFVGSDYYEESESFLYKIPKEPIKIVIPKDLWFDRVYVGVGGWDGDVDVSFRLEVNNGPVVDEHMVLESRAAELIESTIMNTLMEEKSDISSVSFEEWFTMEDLPVNKDGSRTIVIDEIEYSQYVGRDTEIFIEIPNQ